MGLILKQYEDLRKKVKKSELENQRRAFKETRDRQKENLPLMDDFEKRVDSQTYYFVATKEGYKPQDMSFDVDEGA